MEPIDCPRCGRSFPSVHSLRQHRAYAKRIDSPCAISDDERDDARTIWLRYARKRQAKRGPLVFICTCGQGFPSAHSRGSHRSVVPECSGRMPGLKEAEIRRGNEAKLLKRGPLRYKCVCGAAFPSRKSRGAHKSRASRLTPDSPCAGTTKGLREASWRRYYRKVKRRRYGRRWRRDHPTYFVDRRERLGGSRRRSARPRPIAEVEPLFPQLRHGAKVAFWDEELAMDLEQERALALLEGRDPDEAVKQYRVRETSWRRLTVDFDLVEPFAANEEAAQGLP